MTYDLFLFTLVYRNYCTEYANLEFKEQWETAPLIFEVFKNSEYYTKYSDLEANIVCWMESIDWKYNITCDCGDWEEFPADMPRHKSQSFTWIKNCEMTNGAYYECHNCKQTCRSEVIPDFDIGYETSKTMI